MDHAAPHGPTAGTWKAGGHPLTTTPGHMNLVGLSRKAVAKSDATESQKFRRIFSVLLAIAVLIHPTPAKAHVHGCHTRKCDRRVHQHRVQNWCLHHARCVWKHRWLAEEAGWKNWLRHTANCESGNRAHIATGNGYYGLTQFDLATWHEAGGHGYPHQATWYEQAVRSIELAKRVGTGRWPVCGH